MGHSLRQAAEVCGKSRSTIHRALKSGKLSGTRDDNGDWSIDESELARVFPWDRTEPVQRDTMEQSRDISDQKGILEVKVEMLEQQLDREKETVADLRKRLDRAEDRVIALTDQRVGTEKSKGWLANLLRR